LVIEFLSREPIGQGAQAEAKVYGYLQGLCQALSMQPVSPPTAHLSDKFGLAAWLPLKNGGAIHLYIWDNRHPSFISVDILGFGPIDEQKAVAFTRNCFGVFSTDDMVFGRIIPRPSPWRDLAPEIVRQRLLVLSYNCSPPPQESIERFLPALSRELDMKTLSTAVIDRCSAWIHWETSGCVYHWQEEVLSLDIYTCKSFDTRHALSFTQNFLGLPQIISYSY
jgi:S-adenosylmethionine decarboxylase